MIASIWGRESGGRMVYNAVKAAEISLAKAMAQQLAKDNIRVNSVAPGSILFPGGSWDKRQKADPAGIAEFIKTELPFGRFGRAEEVGDAVAFLASPRASWISGSCVPVDGCQSARRSSLDYAHHLVTGGAGYIGSVMTDVLVDGGHDVTVFDNLSRGHRDAISARATFVEGDLVDTPLVLATLKDNRHRSGHPHGRRRAGRRVDGEASPILSKQPDRWHQPARGDARCGREARSSSHRRVPSMASPSARRSTRRMPTQPDQPVRRVEAGLRARARLVSSRAWPQGRRAAVLQRGRRRRRSGERHEPKRI